MSEYVQLPGSSGRRNGNLCGGAPGGSPRPGSVAASVCAASSTASTAPLTVAWRERCQDRIESPSAPPAGVRGAAAETAARTWLEGSAGGPGFRGRASQGCAERPGHAMQRKSTAMRPQARAHKLRRLR